MRMYICKSHQEPGVKTADCPCWMRWVALPRG